MAEAIWNGADCRGAYYNNEEGLNKALTDWLAYRSLDNEYEIRLLEVEMFDGSTLNDIPQIVKKNWIPDSCEDCPYTYRVKRKYGYTIHCEKEPTHMDVTHVDKGTRDSFCPLESGRRKNNGQ